jgi:hypothetical protein
MMEQAPSGKSFSRLHNHFGIPKPAFRRFPVFVTEAQFSD